MNNGLKISNMKKTVLLTDTMSFGGSERTVQILANNQNLGNNKLIVVSLASVWKYPLNENVEKYAIYKKNYPAYLKIIFLPLTLFKLYKKLKKIQPKVVISFHQQSHLLNIILSYFLKYKTVISERAYIERYYGKKNILLKPIISYLYNKATMVLVNDIEIKESLQRFYKIKTNIKVINNLLDTSNFENISKTKRKNDSIFKFITIGRFSEEKNTKDLILAFKKANINNAVLEIIGNGYLMDSLKKLAKSLDIEDKVIFHGHQSNIAKFLSNADVFVFSSLNEGFPNVVLEAMYFGLPIISYKFKAGITTILDNGKYGILTPLKNVDLLAKKMKFLANDNENLTKYKALSYKRIAYFTNKKDYILKYNTIINTILPK